MSSRHNVLVEDCKRTFIEACIASAFGYGKNKKLLVLTDLEPKPPVTFFRVMDRDKVHEVSTIEQAVLIYNEI